MYLLSMQNAYAYLMIRSLFAAITICLTIASASAETLEGSSYCLHTDASVHMRLDFDPLRKTLSTESTILTETKPWVKKVWSEAKLVGQTDKWYFYQTKMDVGYQSTYVVDQFKTTVYVNTISVNPTINRKKSGISTEFYLCELKPFD